MCKMLLLCLMAYLILYCVDRAREIIQTGLEIRDEKVDPPRLIKYSNDIE